jgi:hypothetical protein
LLKWDKTVTIVGKVATGYADVGFDVDGLYFKLQLKQQTGYRK